MPDEVIAPEASPATEVETPALENGLLSDEQLKEIFGDIEDTTETSEEKPATEETETSTPATETTDGIDLKALDELDKVEPKPAETPATPDSEYLNKVKAVLPNEETLGWAVDAFQRTTQAAKAAESGDVNAVLNSLPFMRPVLQKAVMEFVAANEDRIIEAYIQKHDPNAKKDPVVTELQQRLAKFENRFAQEEQASMTAKQQKEAGERLKAIDSEITSLFDKVKFTSNAADRKFVTAAVKVALSENSDVFQKVIGGKVAAMRPIFSKVVKEYVEADKVKTAGATTKVSNNGQKPIIGGGSAQEGGGKKLDVYQRAANFVANLQRSKR